MSVDWTIICDSCKTYRHLGQDMGGIPSFGHGSKDEQGRKEVAGFVTEHLNGYCGDVANGTDKPLRVFTDSEWCQKPEYESYRDLNDESEMPK